MAIKKNVWNAWMQITEGNDDIPTNYWWISDLGDMPGLLITAKREWIYI